MEGLITGPMAEVLRADRAALNARFAEAHRLRPNLGAEAFGRVLSDAVAPIVQAVHQVAPDRTRPVANALYDMALDLVGQDLLGPQSRYPFITRGWTDLLPALPALIAAAPTAVVAPVTNALYNLSVEPNARPLEWIEGMCGLARLAPDLASLLAAGQVVAWRAGLAHYRVGALDVCRRLPAPLAYAALGIPAGKVTDVAPVVDRLLADPWLRPASATREIQGPRTLKLVTRAGAFRGFGGLFRSPPAVACAGEHFLVQDGDTKWVLVADLFGATFHRTDGTQPTVEKSPFALDRNGRVTCGEYALTVAELADASHAAANRTALAVASPLSYAVSLFALVEAE